VCRTEAVKPSQTHQSAPSASSGGDQPSESHRPLHQHAQSITGPTLHIHIEQSPVHPLTAPIPPTEQPLGSQNTHQTTPAIPARRMTSNTALINRLVIEAIQSRERARLLARVRGEPQDTEHDSFMILLN
jgi:hypothetical protein